VPTIKAVHESSGATKADVDSSGDNDSNLTAISDIPQPRNYPPQLVRAMDLLIDHGGEPGFGFAMMLADVYDATGGVPQELQAEVGAFVQAEILSHDTSDETEES
jgi:hypothetical protein